MIAEPYSASLVSQFSLPSTQRMPKGYFRSKLFVISSTSNPLIAAASPLFSLLERLSISPTLPPIHSIRDNIEHELLAFRSRLASQHYAEEFTLIAYYLMSATIDELLGKNYLRLNGKSAEFKAFTPSAHEENEGPQYRFFKIVNYIKERTTQYLDIIELAYYCLITGFEGEHHLRADGRQYLDNLIEELHQLIQQHRVNKPYKLFKEQPMTHADVINYKPMISIGLLAATLLISVYLGCHTLLEHKAKSLLTTNTFLANLDN